MDCLLIVMIHIMDQIVRTRIQTVTPNRIPALHTALARLIHTRTMTRTPRTIMTRPRITTHIRATTMMMTSTAMIVIAFMRALKLTRTRTLLAASLGSSCRLSS